MTFDGKVLAYHGCDRSIGERILAGREHLRISENEYDWLGSGAYFWEASPARAFRWAEFLQTKPESSQGRIQEPFVIGAIVATGRCLDLAESIVPC